MISKKQYTVNFPARLFKHSLGMFIIVLSLLQVSNVSAEEISVVINSHPESNDDSFSKQQKTQIYIVSGTVTSNLTESPSVEITYLPSPSKSKIGKKNNLKKNKKKVESLAQKVTNKNKVEKTETKNYRVIVLPKSQPPSLFAGKNSQDVIVPIRDYRLKIIEYTSGVELSPLINSKIQHFGHYKSLKILTSNSQQSQVRPPPQQYYYFELKLVRYSGC